MTPSEQYWLRVNRRAAQLSPDVAREILKAFQRLRDGLNDAELTRLVSTGQIDRIFDTQLSQAKFDAAMQPVRDRMRSNVSDSFKYFARDIPKRPTVTLAFDTLNPDIITAIRQLETRVIKTLEKDVREVVRAYVENGIRDGVTSSAIAKDLRNVIGLSANQEEAVQNFRRMLEQGDREALTRQLRDKRFDKTLDRVLGAEGEGVAPAQLDKMVSAYRKKMTAYNADTVARTAVLDTQKLGQRLSVNEAVKQGVYDEDRLTKRWVGVLDDRERETHVAMEGETVPYDEPFSNGQMIPGEDEYNCRCVARYTQQAA